jgi:hypothetical protein
MTLPENLRTMLSKNAGKVTDWYFQKFAGT